MSGRAEVEDAFDRLVAEGRDRLSRPLLPLVTTAFVGGVDVGIGVLIFLVVKAQTRTGSWRRWPSPSGRRSVAGAQRVVHRELPGPGRRGRRPSGHVTRLLGCGWSSLAANLIGGIAMAAMIVTALPRLRATAVEAGAHYADSESPRNRSSSRYWLVW